jgi:hypothetical protein
MTAKKTTFRTSRSLITKLHESCTFWSFITSWGKKHTSIVFPLEAVTMSPGLMPVPLIIFSQAATIK